MGRVLRTSGGLCLLSIALGTPAQVLTHGLLDVTEHEEHHARHDRCLLIDHMDDPYGLQLLVDHRPRREPSRRPLPALSTTARLLEIRDSSCPGLPEGYMSAVV